MSGGGAYLLGLVIGLGLGGFLGHRIGKVQSEDTASRLAKDSELIGERHILDSLCVDRCAPERSITRADRVCFCDAKRVELGK